MIELFRLISLPHILRSPGRTLLIVLGIALGVAARVATTTVNASILGAFSSLVDRVSGDVDLVVTNGSAGFPAEVLDEIAELDAVQSASPSLEIVSFTETQPGPVLVMGIDVLRDKSSIQLSSEKGEDVIDDPVSFLNDPKAVVLPKSFAERLGVGVGGKVPLRTPNGMEEFNVHGLVKDSGLAGTFGGQLAVMYLDAAQLSFGRPERLDKIEIKAKKSADQKKLAALLAEKIGDRAQIDTKASRAGTLGNMLLPMRRGLETGGMIALLVGMFLIYNTVSITVVERRKEIGVLRAFGVTRRQAVALFCLEALVMAAVGGAIGLLVAGPLAQVALTQTTPSVSRFYAPIAVPKAVVGTTDAIVGFVLGLASALFAAYFPARGAARVDPVESLKPAESKLEAARPRRWLAGAGLAVMALGVLVGKKATDPNATNAAMMIIAIGGVMLSPTLIVGIRRGLVVIVDRFFGIDSRLALDNAERALGRSALTVSALMTSISASLCLAAWGSSLGRSAFEWLDQALPADFYVTAGSPVMDQHNVPFDASIKERLRGIPGVRNYMALRMVEVDVRDQRISLMKLDSRMYYEELRLRHMAQRVTDGPDPITGEALREKPRIVLSENAAKRLSVRAGESLEIKTPTGRHTLEVYAAAVDYSSDLGFGYVDGKWFDEMFHDDLVDTVDVFVEPTADRAAVAAELRRRIGDDKALFVISSAELRVEIEKVLREFLAVFDSSEFIALAVAILGVLGTMLAAVLDRIREIGILRAIGATRRQVVRSIAQEAAFLALCAVAGGLLVGVPSGIIFVEVLGSISTGWHIEYDLPIAAVFRLAALIVSIAFSVGLFAGRRAVQMEVHTALGYE